MEQALKNSAIFIPFIAREKVESTLGILQPVAEKRAMCRKLIESYVCAFDKLMRICMQHGIIWYMISVGTKVSKRWFNTIEPLFWSALVSDYAVIDIPIEIVLENGQTLPKGKFNLSLRQAISTFK